MRFSMSWKPLYRYEGCMVFVTFPVHRPLNGHNVFKAKKTPGVDNVPAYNLQSNSNIKIVGTYLSFHLMNYRK